MSDIKAGIVVVNRFCQSGSKEFASYLDYIDRKESKRQEMLSEYNLYNDYMDNPEKTTGIFTSEKTKLNTNEKKQLKNEFKKAQDNNSLMWQTVISFDNRWLAEHGLYNVAEQIIDERKLKELATGAVNKMLKNEKLDNAVWSGAIHYNTDNIHIHIAIVETDPQREKKEYQQFQYKTSSKGEYVLLTNGEYARANGRNEYNKYGQMLPRYDRVPRVDKQGNPVVTEEYVGRFKPKSIEACKKYMVDNIFDQKKENILINQIIREQIVKQKKTMQLQQDNDLRDQFIELYNLMPQVNKNLWNYNNNIMAKLQPQIDRLTDLYLKKYHDEDYRKLKEILQNQSVLYSKAYGKSDRIFEENKIRELYERMGNSILKEIRAFDNSTSQMNDINRAEQKNADVQEGKDEPIFLPLDMEIEDKSYMEWSKDYKKAKKLLFSIKKNMSKEVKKKTYQEALTLFQEEAKKGNVLAVYDLGDIYKYGKGVKLDNDKAATYYHEAFKRFHLLYQDKAYEKQQAYILYRLGKQYDHGIGTSQDYEKAYTFYKESNNRYAKYSLGNLYYNGNGVEQNYKEAYRCYEKSVDEGQNAYASYKMAEMSENGIGVEKDDNKSDRDYGMAFSLFMHMNEEQPDDNLQYRLGTMLLYGKGTEKSRTMALEYFEQSAENGNPYAQYQLAKLYLESDQIEDITKAIGLLEQSGNKGKNAMAQYALGKLFLDAEQPEIRDIQKAEKWLLKADENKNSYASYALGKLYQKEIYGICDMEKATIFYKKAGKAGNEYAAYALGKILIQSGKNEDILKGGQWLKQAADAGNEYAAYAIGKECTDEESTLFDTEKGMKYLKQSAENGNSYAALKLGSIYLKGNIVEKNKETARFWLQQAADAGNPYATDMLNNIDKPSGKKKQKWGRRFAMELNLSMIALKRALDKTHDEQRINMREYQELIHQIDTSEISQ